WPRRKLRKVRGTGVILLRTVETVAQCNRGFVCGPITAIVGARQLESGAKHAGVHCSLRGCRAVWAAHQQPDTYLPYPAPVGFGSTESARVVLCPDISCQGKHVVGLVETIDELQVLHTFDQLLFIACHSSTSRYGPVAHPIERW